MMQYEDEPPQLTNQVYEHLFSKEITMCFSIVDIKIKFACTKIFPSPNVYLCANNDVDEPPPPPWLKKLAVAAVGSATL